MKVMETETAAYLVTFNIVSFLQEIIDKFYLPVKPKFSRPRHDAFGYFSRFLSKLF